MSLRDRITDAVRQLTPTGGTAERAVKGFVWVMGQNVFGRVLQLSLLVILARFIGPTGIGLIGIALLVLSGLRKFTDIGLNAALIYDRDENVDHYLDTVWVLEIGRGLLICIVVFLGAPLISSFFSEPNATDIIRAMSLSPLLYGLRNPGVVYFQKELEFHKQFIYQVGTQVVRFVVGIAAILVSPTAWAYVVAFLVADVARTLFSYGIHEYRPWPRFDWDAARNLIDYGKWITGSSIVYFLYSEGDDAFVGWLLSPAALAFYQYGYRFSNAPATEFSQVLSNVMFPALSQMQDDTDRLRNAFLETLRMTCFVAFPAALGIAAIAPSFVRAFLGEQWAPMILAMQILAVYGLMRAVGKTFSPVWRAVGRPDIATKLGVLRLVLIAILIYPLTTEFGIAGTALTVTLVSIFPLTVIDMHITKDIIDTTFRRIAYEFLYPSVASAFMFGCVWAVHLEVTVAPIVEFVLLIVVGIVTYVGAVVALESQFEWGIRQDVKTVVTNVQK
jgi:PST family polysaccharide transporter/lipopolysaccharide exporter